MRLIILGSGGYGRTVKDLATQLNYKCLFLDDSLEDHPLSSFVNYLDEDTSFIVAMGNNSLRLNWLNKIKEKGGKLATLIHPSCYISPLAEIEEGTVVLPHAVINTNVLVKRGSIINLNAIIDHDSIIEEGCHLCLGSIVKGENHIKALTKIEAGQIIEARFYQL